MKPKIISIGYAVPDGCYSQEEVFGELRYPRTFGRLFTESGIKERHFWVPLGRIRHLSWQEQQDEYMVGATFLSHKAVKECLDRRKVESIGCLVFCSCTGFSPGPTIAHYLGNWLGMRHDTYYTNIGSQGCESGFPGLKRAADYTLASGRRSLVVTCELSSCSYFPEPEGKPDRENHFELARSNERLGYNTEQKSPISQIKDKSFEFFKMCKTCDDNVA